MTRISKWAGIGAVLLFIASIVVAAGFTEGDMPLPGASGAEIQEYMRHNADLVALGALLQAAAGVALLWFTVWLYGRLPRPYAAAVLAGGAGSVALQIVSAASTVVMTKPEVYGHADVLPAIQWLGFGAGGSGVVALMALIVAGAALGADVPRGLRVAGIVVAALASLALLGLVTSVGTPFIPAGRFGTYLWIVAATPYLARL